METENMIIISNGALLLILACLALYIYCIVDIHKLKVKHQSEKTIWLNIIWFAPLIGCIVYLLNRRRIHRKANTWI